ncbi:hypothetical protein GCM10009738_58900 [Kitasatospora viridis]
MLATATQSLLALYVALATADALSPAFFHTTARFTITPFLAVVVVFLCWFRRCRRNAEVQAPGRHRYSPNSAVGLWFVPVVMWWAPRRIALDIWRASDAPGRPWAINAWWWAWLAKSVGVTAYVVIDLDGNANSPFFALVDVLASALAVLMIQQVTTAQRRKAAAAATAGGAV